MIPFTVKPQIALNPAFISLTLGPGLCGLRLIPPAILFLTTEEKPGPPKRKNNAEGKIRC